MTILQDDEWRLGDMLHATPLRPGEYVWGKFTALLSGVLAYLPSILRRWSFSITSCPTPPRRTCAAHSRLNYFRPAFLMRGPIIVFLSGFSIAGRRADPWAQSLSSCCRSR